MSIAWLTHLGRPYDCSLTFSAMFVYSPSCQTCHPQPLCQRAHIQNHAALLSKAGPAWMGVGAIVCGRRAVRLMRTCDCRSGTCGPSCIMAPPVPHPYRTPSRYVSPIYLKLRCVFYHFSATYVLIPLPDTAGYTPPFSLAPLEPSGRTLLYQTQVPF